MPIKFTDPATATPFVEAHAGTAAELPGFGVSWVRELRKLAIERFAALGFPTLKHEAWRPTDLKGLIASGLVAGRPAIETTVDKLPGHPNNPRLVFVDGELRPALSILGDLPEGAELVSLAAALDGDPEWIGERLGRTAPIDASPFVALNTAFLRDGAILRLGRGVRVERPIELVFVSAGPIAVYPRLLIVAEPGSSAILIEHHVGLGDSAVFANHVAEIVVEEGAALTHHKVQTETPASFHIANTHVRVGKDARYRRLGLNLGGALSRDEIVVTLAEPGAEAHVDGAYVARGSQLLDTTVLVDHAAPNCASRQVHKGVIDDEATGVFQGRVLVRRGAGGTDGQQTHRALLLSDRARVDAKPELEIFADDVKCGHGATVGELDAEQLFYLRARGIPEDRARSLLITAFVEETLDGVEDERLRETYGDLITSRLGDRS